MADSGVLRITLVRHAPSAHVHAGWLDSAGFAAWREAYEAAGIREGSAPPPEIVELAQEAAVIVSSDARRAIESARLLASGRVVETAPLVRELDLLAPPLGRLPLPMAGWALAVGLRSLWMRLASSASHAREAQRVRDAAEWLTQQASQRGSVLVVTHASVRGLLSDELIARGWTPAPGRRTLRTWSARSFHPRAGGHDGSP